MLYVPNTFATKFIKSYLSESDLSKKRDSLSYIARQIIPNTNESKLKRFFSFRSKGDLLETNRAKKFQIHPNKPPESLKPPFLKFARFRCISFNEETLDP